MVTQELLKDYYEYKNGSLYNKKKRQGITVGSRAGTWKGLYRQISINRKFYLEHRLIWLYHYGKLPDGPLDHINGVCDDNRIENLRECTFLQNQFNRCSEKSSSSKYKGVYFKKDAQKWVAQNKVYGRLNHLGTFDCEVEAAKAYDKAVKDLHGEFARLNFG